MVILERPCLPSRLVTIVVDPVFMKRTPVSMAKVKPGMIVTRIFIKKKVLVSRFFVSHVLFCSALPFPDRMRSVCFGTKKISSLEEKKSYGEFLGYPDQVFGRGCFDTLPIFFESKKFFLYFIKKIFLIFY